MSRAPAKQGSPGGSQALKWLTPGLRVKRWMVLFAVCTLAGALGFLHFMWTGPLRPLAHRWIDWIGHALRPEFLPVWWLGLLMFLVALAGALYAITQLNRAILRGVGAAEGNTVDLMYSRHTLARGARIVAVGEAPGFLIC
ncbi:hypothetical protein ACFP81_01355 [Deinococcus lacus]|uniref:ABC transporter permease n=1 Tax=Deinococcus lacus TaxID=392561 RepID=A0ABW1YBQ0_9DEIO